MNEEITPKPKRRKYEEHFAALAPHEQIEMLRLLAVGAAIVDARMKRRQAHCDKVAAKLLDDVTL